MILRPLWLPPTELGGNEHALAPRGFGNGSARKARPRRGRAPASFEHSGERANAPHNAGAPPPRGALTAVSLGVGCPRLQSGAAFAPPLLLSLFALALFSLAACHPDARARSSARPDAASAAAPQPPRNDSPFAPSPLHLAQGSKALDLASLSNPALCEGCHADVVAQWQSSAHRSSSFNNRFYAAAVDLTRADRGAKATRWCAGCHDPSLLLDARTDPAGGLATALETPDVARHPRAGDGIGCLVCHQTTSGSRLGNGGYHLEPHAFRAPEIDSPSSVEAHKKAMRPSALGGAEFCASCHKVSIPAEVNNKRWYRGQNDFDAWEQGPFSSGGHASAGPVYDPDVTATSCRGCHMPPELATRGDLSAKPLAGAPAGARGVASHRFLGGNTALAALSGDADMASREAAFLRGAVRVDLVALRRGGSRGTATPAESASFAPQERVALDLVVENLRTGHRFPGGTADSNQVWLSLVLRDARSRVIAESGALDNDGELDPDAHLFGVLQLDRDGAPARRRDAHRFAALGWDTTLAPRDARVLRYVVTPPPWAEPPFRAEARVLHRKFSAAYAAFSCQSRAAISPPPRDCPTPPLTEIARDELTLGGGDAARSTSPAPPPRWRRSLAYARGLMQAVQEEAGDASAPLDEVITLAPARAEGHIERARLAIRRGRTADALAALDEASRLAPQSPCIPFLRGLAHAEVYRLGDAVDPLRRAVALAPHHLPSNELLAEALELRHNPSGALDVTRAALAIDPESAQLYHLTALAYDQLGRPADAAVARDAYDAYRRDDDTPRLRSRCKATVPGCARESNPLHAHELTARPTPGAR